jgi:hypothetical protein
MISASKAINSKYIKAAQNNIKIAKKSISPNDPRRMESMLGFKQQQRSNSVARYSKFMKT